MSLLTDTSILVRLANVDDSQYEVAARAVAELRRRGETLFVAAQNLTEFWNVGTRPKSANGLELARGRVIERIKWFETRFVIAQETPEVWPALQSLYQQVEIIGKQIHDARLVAVCHVQGIASVLTFNARHFTRYSNVPPGINVVEPAAIIQS